MSAVIVASKSSLIDLAKQEDITVLELVTRAINKHQSVVAAAQSLRVTPGAIHYHLKKHHMRVETRMVPVIVSDLIPA